MNERKPKPALSLAALRAGMSIGLLPVALGLMNAPCLAGAQSPHAQQALAQIAWAQSVPATATASAPVVRRDVFPATIFSPRENALLRAFTDGSTDWAGAGLFILLDHARRLTDDAEDIAIQADPITFWTQPSNYRGRLMSLDVIYTGRTDEHVGPDDEFWQGQKYYLVHVKSFAAPEAIVVAMPEPLPAGYARGQRLHFTGFFYKTVKWQIASGTGNSEESRIYPLLVAKAMTPLVKESAGAATSFQPITIVVIIVLLFAVVWMFLRMRGLRAGPARLHQSSPAVPQEDFQVDPDLQQAVRQLGDSPQK